MRRPIELPPEIAQRPFGVREALELGVPPARLRSSRLAHPFWGVRSATDSYGVDLLRAFGVRMPRRAFYFGLSAAVLHELPLPPRLAKSPPVHVGVGVNQRRVSARDVVAHHVTIADSDILSVQGMAVTSIERTWCDLAAAGLSLGELVAAGDAALWRRRPRTTLEKLRSATTRYDSRRGARLIRDALPLLSNRSDSAPESELRVAFVCSGLPEPLANEQIRDGRRLVASPDLSWPRARLAVEYEGDHHRSDPAQWRYDIERYSRLQDMGWLVFRATGADYRDPRQLIERVRRALSTRP